MLSLAAKVDGGKRGGKAEVQDVLVREAESSWDEDVDAGACVEEGVDAFGSDAVDVDLPPFG